MSVPNVLYPHFYQFRVDKSQVLPFFNQLRAEKSNVFLWQDDSQQQAFVAAQVAVNFYQDDNFRYQNDFIDNQFTRTTIAQTNPDFYKTVFKNYLHETISPEQLATLKIWTLLQNHQENLPKAYFGLMRYNFHFDFARQQLSALVLSPKETENYEAEILYLLQQAHYQPQPLQQLGSWQTETEEADYQANLKQLYQQCRQGQFVSKPILRPYQTQFEGSYLDYFSAWRAAQHKASLSFFYEWGDFNIFGMDENSQIQPNFRVESPAFTVGFYDLSQNQAIFNTTYTCVVGRFPCYLAQSELLIIDKNLNKLYIQQSQERQQKARNSPF